MWADGLTVLGGTRKTDGTALLLLTVLVWGPLEVGSLLSARNVGV